MMSNAIQQLQLAMQRAMAGRPTVGGFPYLAETLRQAGVSRNVWQLPSCQSLYLTTAGSVMVQGAPLITAMVEVPPFDEAALIAALRKDQAGQSSFEAFLAASWAAGVVRYDVDFTAREVSYYGALGEVYVESYPAVNL